jgi:alkylated DNA repair protein (DNA oxidative demethylase)
MTRNDHEEALQGQLFRDTYEGAAAQVESLVEGATLLRGFAEEYSERLMSDLRAITASAPFRHMVTPNGAEMSVAMSNCGEVGWVSDRKGYRYDPNDPVTGRHWPAMPASFIHLSATAAEAGGFPGFTPDACLINRYQPGARLSLHQDRDERDFTAPIVSVSLGLPAVFLFGVLKRTDKPRRIPLRSGDVVVWGGPARLVFHGVAPLAQGSDPLTGECRINLTFRKAQ